MTNLRKHRILFLMLFLVCVVFLLVGHKPWDDHLMERFFTGSLLLLDELIALFSWLAAAVNGIVLGLLYLTCPLWISDDLKPNDPLPLRPSGFSRTIWISFAILGIGLAGILAYPRLTQSYWGDECFTMRIHVHGYWDRDPNRDEYKNGRIPFFRLLGWNDAIYGYFNTNNHFLYSIAGKASLITWQKITGAEAWEFREWVLRLVPYLCGLISIPFWMRLLAAVGLPRAGLLLAPLLAIHPWFIRYISEARGYALLMLFIPIVTLVFFRAAQTSRWKWWWLYALFQFLALYSWPGYAAQCVLLNLFGLHYFWRKQKNRGTTIRTFVRFDVSKWALANLFTILVLVQMISPTVPQVLPFLTENQLSLPVDGKWLTNIAGRFLIGTEWITHWAMDDNPIYLSVGRMNERHPILTPLVTVLIFPLAIIGVIRWLTLNSRSRLLAITFLLSTFAFWFYGHSREKYLFPWYFVYLVPVFVSLVASGIDWVCNLTRNPSTNHVLFATVGAAFTLCYAVIAEPKLKALIEHPIDPLRESVEATPGRIIDVKHPANFFTISAHMHFWSRSYDAHAQIVPGATSNNDVYPGLTRVMWWADDYDLPLYVNVGYARDARQMPESDYRYGVREAMNLLDNKNMFEHCMTLHGHEPQLTREIFRYKGGVFDFKKKTKSPDQPEKEH